MTIGRFGADRVSRRFGPVNVVRFGSVVAAFLPMACAPSASLKTPADPVEIKRTIPGE